jgi:hypothetical protein
VIGSHDVWSCLDALLLPDITAALFTADGSRPFELLDCVLTFDFEVDDWQKNALAKSSSF